MSDLLFEPSEHFNADDRLSRPCSLHEQDAQTV